MTSAKEIKKRIKSIANTKKITKAMEMVAAAKMRRSIEAVLRTRAYAQLGWATIVNISESAGSNKLKHPLLDKREKLEREAIVLIASNRGLCGGFNSAVINKAIKSIKKHGNIKTDFIIIGKKASVIGKRMGYKIISEFLKDDVKPEIANVTPVAKLIIDRFLGGEYDKVMLAYTDFVSPSKQVPRIRQLLPIKIEAEDKYLGVTAKSEKLEADENFAEHKEQQNGNSRLFIYEPDDRDVLDKLLPRMIEVQLFQGLLESNASEHSARMNSMHQATGAASDLVGELTLFYNKARQAAITSEIAEISSGVASLKI